MQKSAEKAEALQLRLDTLKDIEAKYTELQKEVGGEAGDQPKHEELQLHLTERQVSVRDEVSKEEIRRLREDTGVLRGRLEAVGEEEEVKRRVCWSRKISRDRRSNCRAKIGSCAKVGTRLAIDCRAANGQAERGVNACP